MPRELIIKGNTPEEKLKHVETILRRMFRRLHRVIIGVVPPVPIFGYCDIVPDNGAVFRYVVPVRATLIRACLDFRDKGSPGPARFMFSLSSGGTVVSKGVEVKNKTLVTDLDIEVFPGNILLCIVGENTVVHGVSVSVLMRIDKSECDTEKIAIDKFDTMLREEDDISV